MTIGERVRQWRELLKLDQTELAKSSGLSRSVISTLERGVHMPKWDTLESIITALKLTPVEFFELGEPRKGRAETVADEIEVLAALDLDFQEIDVSKISRADLLRMLSTANSIQNTVIKALASISESPGNPGEEEALGHSKTNNSG